VTPGPVRAWGHSSGTARVRARVREKTTNGETLANQSLSLLSNPVPTLLPQSPLLSSSRIRRLLWLSLPRAGRGR
jgi:hypothetical protein